jgi:hypothetical protein
LVEDLGMSEVSASRTIFVRHRAAVARDPSLLRCRDNLNFVGGGPETLKAAGGRGSNGIAVLSDAAGEDQKIQAAQERHV